MKMAQLLQRVDDLEAKSKEAAADAKVARFISPQKSESSDNLALKSAQDKRKK
ncbi:hypothetical protein D3C81_2323510 [compost metagenome]